MAGVQYLEPNRNYSLPIIFHNSLVFPGETVPMILSQNMLSVVMSEFKEEGLLFGLICRETRNYSNKNLYGVTCQIYEKSTDDVDSVSIKSRACQRFFIKNNEYVDLSLSPFLSLYPSKVVRSLNFILIFTKMSCFHSL